MLVPFPSDICLHHKNKPRFASCKIRCHVEKNQAIAAEAMTSHPVGNVSLIVDALGSPAENS